MSNKKNRPEDNAVPEQEAKNQEAEERETPPEQGAQNDAAEDAKAAEAKTEEAAPQPDDCASKLAAEHDRYLRLAAEYDNYRKRSQRERDSIFNDVRSDTVTKFLPVYDNLVRALEQSTADEAYRKGVEMIMTQFKDILSRLGVTEIESVGKTFDPALHNAVMHDTDESQGENIIVQELQKGFKMGDKVIRFAMVKVVN
ncbi:MAG TPA: nucleotide exchange factor GrpE [Candidatus Scatomorpha gallistercoris]|nr:nucleotide exchange factor GrpE [Candidatus Scatomorpha gallistercoris]